MRTISLVELPKTAVYVENYPELDDAIFSSDHSEYIPTLERIERYNTPSSISGLSVNSQCFDKIDTINTPGTISNLSMILANSDFIASSTVIYKILKKLVNPVQWRRDTNGNVIRWSDDMDVHVTPSQPRKIYFKYDFDGNYLELDTLHSTQIRRRGRKSKPDSPIKDIALVPAYHQPIPISKALHTDLLSLCNSGAIPRYYHNFYESLTYSQDNINIGTEEISDNDD
ncbi:hypothetical protein ACJJTC_011316 [Scirpophaga incertulas]